MNLESGGGEHLTNQTLTGRKQEWKLTSVSRSLHTLAVIIIKLNKEER